MQVYNDKCFLNPIDTLVAFSNSEFIEALKKIEEYKNKGLYLLGYVRYSAKDIFMDKEVNSKLPLLFFEVYESYSSYIPYQTKKDVSIYSEPQISFEQYSEALNKIKKHIAKGNTYEVNYTYSSKVYTNTDSLTLYNHLIQKQKTDYNCFIINNWDKLLSFSPELFFKIEDNRIITKPMKGTISRGVNKKEDIKNLIFLHDDEKNQAENVMIVDLLRNDLSKIAKTGTIKVDKLFDIEFYSTLYQMISEVSAELKENITLFDIFSAIFPCGSITGAPKIFTMDIIEELEYYPRNIYCGAIGYISKDECIFSVPIRILQKHWNNKYFNYFSGGAIVWDSDIKEEWDETILKKKFITPEIKYDLIETVLIKDNEVKLYEYHKNRLKESAKQLGFKFDENDFVFDTSKDRIARYSRSQKGFSKIEYREINLIKSNKIKVEKNRMNSNNKLLYYKTSFRPWYSYILDDYFDVVFLNERDELTEGTRSNLVLEIDGKLYTPSLHSGLLNGTYRQYLLDEGKIEERVLYLNDLKNATKIYCINSVRGMVEVEL